MVFFEGLGGKDFSELLAVERTRYSAYAEFNIGRSYRAR
jgi:hypothetical protein